MGIHTWSYRSFKHGPVEGARGALSDPQITMDHFCWTWGHWPKQI